MATKAKDGTHGREKARGTSLSNSHSTISIPHKRSPGQSPSGSSPATPSDKPVPNYLKPTISSRHLTDTTPKPSLNRRRSFDKPPSPSREQKALQSPSPTPKERTSPKERTFRSLSISSKTQTSPKPVSERLSKPSLASAKSHLAFAKAKSVKKSTSPTSKKGSSAAAGLTAAPSIPDTTNNISNIEFEHEDPEALLTCAVEEDVEELNDESKEDPSEISILENKEHVDLVSSEAKSVEEKIELPCESASSVSEEQSASRAAQIEETEEKANDEEHGDNPHEMEERHIKDEGEKGYAEESFAGELQVEAKDEAGEDAPTENPDIGNENTASTEESEEENKEEKEEQDDDGTRKMEGGVEGGKAPEGDNPVLKRHGTQGKKDAPAYNDVIEETASKLLEKRKNKVKALVGAFETVISLQEPEA